LPKILFLTTHNLATNPRLVKEILLALENNFTVEVICFEFENWSEENNEKLKKELTSVKFITIPAGRKPLLLWFFSVVNEQISRKLILLLKSERLFANAVSRRSRLIIKNLNKVSKPDWVTGNNPGDMYDTALTPRKFNCKAGFDVEDYHPGEGNDRRLQGLTKQLMQQLLPKMDYVSFAAPLIMEEVNKSQNRGVSNWFTVLNYFPSEEFALSVAPITGPLKLVWFSQNISFSRGLELILPAVESHKGKVELHLYGNVDEDFKKLNLDGFDNILLHGPVSQQQLHRQLARYDVGLALEPAKDRNNDLAISNKLLSYLQAGLYVIATNTKGQRSFINNFPDMGICFDYTKDNSGNILEDVFNTLDSIRNNRKIRFERFRINNWANESACLLKNWNNYT